MNVEIVVIYRGDSTHTAAAETRRANMRTQPQFPILYIFGAAQQQPETTLSRPDQRVPLRYCFTSLLYRRVQMTKLLTLFNCLCLVNPFFESTHHYKKQLSAKWTLMMVIRLKRTLTVR